MDINYVGSRYDRTFTANSYTTKLKPYTKVDLAGSYDIIDNFTIFGRIENLFNEKYTEIWGYQTPKFSAYAGGKLSY
jgi:vitamin B12 transporter